MCNGRLDACRLAQKEISPCNTSLDKLLSMYNEAVCSV